MFLWSWVGLFFSLYLILNFQSFWVWLKLSQVPTWNINALIFYWWACFISTSTNMLSLLQLIPARGNKRFRKAESMLLFATKQEAIKAVDTRLQKPSFFWKCRLAFDFGCCNVLTSVVQNITITRQISIPLPCDRWRSWSTKKFLRSQKGKLQCYHYGYLETIFQLDHSLFHDLI